MKSTLPLFLILSLILNPLTAVAGKDKYKARFDIATAMLESDFMHMHPEKVRRLQADYLPLPTAAQPKNRNRMDLLFYAGTKQNINQVVEPLIKKFAGDNLTLRNELTSFFFHAWATMVFAQKGFQTASIKEHHELFRSLFAFNHYTYPANNSREYDERILEMIISVMLLAKAALGYLTPVEEERVRTSLLGLPQSLEKIRGTTLAKLDIRVSNGGAIFLKFASSLLAGELTAIASKILLTNYAFFNLGTDSYLAIALALAAVAPAFLVIPPTSALTQPRRYKIEQVENLIKPGCPLLLEALSLSPRWP